MNVSLVILIGVVGLAWGMDKQYTPQEILQMEKHNQTQKKEPELEKQQLNRSKEKTYPYDFRTYQREHLAGYFLPRYTQEQKESDQREYEIRLAELERRLEELERARQAREQGKKS